MFANLGEELKLSALDTLNINKVKLYINPFLLNISNTL